MPSDGDARVQRTTTSTTTSTVHRAARWERKRRPMWLAPLAALPFLGGSLMNDQIEDTLTDKASALGYDVDFQAQTGSVCVSDDKFAAAKAALEEIPGVDSINRSTDADCRPSAGNEVTPPDTTPVTEPAPTPTTPAVTQPADTDPPVTTPEITEPALPTIIEVAVADGGLTQFNELVAGAGLTDTLQGDGPFTVFAPSDAAFGALPPATVEALQNDPELLAAVLKNHVVAGQNMSSDLESGDIDTIDGAALTLAVGDSVTVASNGETATVTKPDLVGSNGVVHIIDTVLLGTVEIPAPPVATALAVNVEYDGARMALDGVVDNEAQANAIRDAAVAALVARGGTADQIDDRLEIRNTPAGDAVTAADAKAGQLAQLLGALPPNFVFAKAGIAPDLYLEGTYLDDAAKARAEEAATASGVPAGSVNISPREQATAQDRDQIIAELNKLFVATTVQFARGRAEILPESNPLLDDAAAKLRQFELGDIKILIEGHTDSDGSDASNQTLSQARAAAVRAALIERGVDGNALVAQGFGESRPIADNATVEGKARNRRVQFSAQQ